MANKYVLLQNGDFVYDGDVYPSFEEAKKALINEAGFAEDGEELSIWTLGKEVSSAVAHVKEAPLEKSR